jgi:hypothetical protein
MDSTSTENTSTTYDVTTTIETLTTEVPNSTNDQKIGSKMNRQKVCYQRHFSFSYLVVGVVPVVVSSLDVGPVVVVSSVGVVSVITFVSDLLQDGGFLWVLRFSQQIELTATK